MENMLWLLVLTMAIIVELLTSKLCFFTSLVISRLSLSLSDSPAALVLKIQTYLAFIYCRVSATIYSVSPVEPVE